VYFRRYPNRDLLHQKARCTRDEVTLFAVSASLDGFNIDPDTAIKHTYLDSHIVWEVECHLTVNGGAGHVRTVRAVRTVRTVRTVLTSELKKKRELSRSGLGGYRRSVNQILVEIVQDCLQCK
jgi:hypothetical protein